MKNTAMKKTISICNLALLVGLTSCGGGAIRTVEYSTPAGEAKLISYNIRQSGMSDEDGKYQWNNRREATANMIQKEAPSVFGLQEALLEQVQYVEKCFPQYARFGVGRDDGRDGGEFMAVFYLKDYYELSKQGTVWLSETPDTVSQGWDAACKRTLTWVKLREKATGKEFYFFNTHFDHRGETAREESAKLIVRKIQEIVKSDEAIIFGGDLNSAITDTIFNPLKEALSIARDCSPVTDNKGTFNGFGSAPSSIVIDHFFCRNVTCVSFRTLVDDYGAPFISDHYPIEFVVRLN
jgi:endonuclease/exonuclease/phosphatase family metal-dependent hydrolase